jgi:predicted MFS family arabinose efflux permease
MVQVSPTPVLRQSRSDAALYLLATGSFAVGTGAFIIAAVLPDIATDLAVEPGTAGQLVVAYSFAYAVSAPVFTTLTRRLNKRWLLLFSMSVFTAGNAIAAFAETFGSLLAARILVAAVAGLYVPNANAVAGALVPLERRGRALAIVSGGLSVAIAIGVPVGAFVSAKLGWRFTFAGVAITSCVATIGLMIWLPREIGVRLPSTSLGGLWSTLARHETLLTLGVTAFWAMGGYVVYPYIALVFRAGIGMESSQVGAILFLYGIAACVGLVVGGRGTDRFGAGRVVLFALPIIAFALSGLSIAPHFFSGTITPLCMLASVFVWALCGWAFFPAQQARLIGLAGVSAAPLILSLNTAFQYIGYSIGASLGSVVLARATALDLGWVGGLAILVAVIIDWCGRPSPSKN